MTDDKLYQSRPGRTYLPRPKKAPSETDDDKLYQSRPGRTYLPRPKNASALPAAATDHDLRQNDSDERVMA